MEKQTHGDREIHTNPNDEPHPTTNARRFGMRSESGPIQQLKTSSSSNLKADSKERETTAWEIYNKRSLIVDRELIKDWNDGLNTLLIFVRIFLFFLLFFDSLFSYMLKLQSKLMM